VSSVAARLDTYLARIAALNRRFRAFSTVDAEGARTRAAEIDAASRDGRWPGLLHGMTVAIKDNIDKAGLPAASGSRLFAGRIAPSDAPVVARLREAGAITVGKAAMMELAFGVRSLDAVAGQCRNPWDPARIPGGSSGGSAIAVALDLVDAALGTDTGGSVRVPAGFCGVTGLRPTIGLVPNRGVLPVSVSLDTVGPMARRVEDVARVLLAIAGHDPEDPFSVDRAPDPSLLHISGDVKGLRIGVPCSFYFDDIDAEIADAVRSVADMLARAGAQLIDVKLEGAAEAHGHATTIIYCDACALHAKALDAKPANISAPVFERMIQGRNRSGVDYAAALRFREAWTMGLRDVFRQVDALLYPTSPYPAPPIVEQAHLEEATRHTTRFTYGGSLAGLPSLTLPCGFTRSGLPIGTLLEGAWWHEADLLRLGKAWQDRTDWHLRIPPVHAETAARPRVPRSRSRADMRADDSRGGKVDAT
jgi:aspartyl-tRNA(Asn)/glutamyl-tRNA(Gln) amidotransferase subunit A